jgi:anaerobic magnesium-protoporphyrin IX monomethyl ester cyclase
MYGRSFRTFPIDRVLADIDDIYHLKRTRSIFITDDNIVLSPSRLMELCDAIIARDYRGLRFFVQADCATMAKREDMVAKMAEAGFSSIFLGIENISKKNLRSVNKGNAATFAKKAIENCHKYGMMVIGGLIFGFPEDNEETIRENYQFFKSIDADTAYCQVLTPYPKTGIREDLLNQGMVINQYNYKKYNGLWANVRTHHLDAEQLQYQFWYQRQVVLGWWKPPKQMKNKGWAWVLIWRFAFKPILKFRFWIIMRKYGWEGRYNLEIERWKKMNTFQDLSEY